ncbi:hypothetical protein Tco_1173682, partial [Tanacetum coccineum]
MEIHSLLQTVEQWIKKIDVFSSSCVDCWSQCKLLIPTGKERPQKESLIMGLRERLNLRLQLQVIQRKQCDSTATQRGHWKRTFPKYLKDLKDGKVKKGSHSGSKGKHVNRKRTAQLQKDGVLESFDFKLDDVLGVLEEIQESVDEEPIMNTNTQQELVTSVKPDDISLPIRIISGRVSKPPQIYYGFHIEE